MRLVHIEIQINKEVCIMAKNSYRKSMAEENFKNTYETTTKGIVPDADVWQIESKEDITNDTKNEIENKIQQPELDENEIVNKEVDDVIKTNENDNVDDLLAQLDDIALNDNIQDEDNFLTSAAKKLSDAVTNLGNNIKAKTAKVNPLEPNWWKSEVKERRAKPPVIKSESEMNKKDEQKPGPEQSVREDASNTNDIQVNKQTIVRNNIPSNRVPYNPLKPNAAREYMERNGMLQPREQTTPPAKIAIEREVLEDESNKVISTNVSYPKERQAVIDKSRKLDLLENLLRQNEEKRTGHILENENGREKNEPENDIPLEEIGSRLEDMINDNANVLDSNLNNITEEGCIDIGAEEKTNEEEKEQQQTREIDEPNEKDKNKYYGNNPWIKKCIKEIEKTENQMTALEIAKQFMAEKPDEMALAKKVNVICKDDVYVLQVITGDKEAKTYEISKEEWEANKGMNNLFENRRAEYKKIMPMKDVLRVDRNNVNNELDRLGKYRNGLEYMREKLEPINAKRRWQTLGLTRRITTGENKDKLEKADKQEFRNIRGSVNDTNIKFGLFKNKRYEHNKENIIKQFDNKNNKGNGFEI